MKCLQCGSRTKTKHENYRYDACGLSGVTLMHVAVSRCPVCGETEVAIPNVEGLHRTLAVTLARKTARLTPDEIHFLRKYLGFSGADFAAHLGVTAESVSRWEQGVKPMGQIGERLLRWMVFTRQPLSHYPLDLLKDMAKENPKPSRMGMKAEHGNWKFDPAFASA